MFDLLINAILTENFKKKIGTSRNYSLKSVKFHHEIAPNINVYEHWGKNKYKVITNQLGMRIGNNESYNIKSLKENIGFLGDSFVYGSGIDYENHFISLINKNNKNYNYLNLGYVSYSPSIYYKKLKFLIEKKNINFKKIFIFVDHSDVQDEALFYREDDEGNIVRKWLSDNEIKKRNKKYIFKNYFKQNSFIFKFYENLNSPTISKKSKNCITDNSNKNYKNYIDINRFGYGYNKDLTEEKWVKKGNKKIKYYLEKINKLSKENDFKIYIIYYPSALEVIDNINYNLSKHYIMLKNFSELYNSRFVNITNDFFIESNGKNNYLKYFIECDVHWNKNGHKIIADRLIKFINE